MIYSLVLHTAATVDLDEIHQRISLSSLDAADRTYDRLKQAILTLAEFPKRFPVAPESAKTSLEMRHTHVGNYRIIFSILGEQVHVWRVVHAARQSLDPGELN